MKRRWPCAKSEKEEEPLTQRLVGPVGPGTNLSTPLSALGLWNRKQQSAFQLGMFSWEGGILRSLRSGKLD